MSSLSLVSGKDWAGRRMFVEVLEAMTVLGEVEEMVLGVVIVKVLVMGVMKVQVAVGTQVVGVGAVAVEEPAMQPNAETETDNKV